MQATHLFRNVVFIFKTHIHRTLLMLCTFFFNWNNSTWLLYWGVSRIFTLWGVGGGAGGVCVKGLAICVEGRKWGLSLKSHLHSKRPEFTLVILFVLAEKLAIKIGRRLEHSQASSWSSLLLYLVKMCMFCLLDFLLLLACAFTSGAAIKSEQKDDFTSFRHWASCAIQSQCQPHKYLW